MRIEKYAQVRIEIVSSPSGPVMTLGRFSIAPTPMFAAAAHDRTTYLDIMLL